MPETPDQRYFDRTPDRLTGRGALALLQGLERLNMAASTIDTTPFLDPDQFDWIRPLEESWELIRSELDQILRFRDRLPSFHEISEDQTSITRDKDWKTYFLYGYGYRAEVNCARCPETARLVEQIPGMKTAFFSILSPGKHIPDHRGPYNGVIRYHLGLKVPEPAEQCRIRVADQYAHWEEGESLVFDDTYRHEVWNETDGERAILFVDVLRPLRFPMNWVNRGVMRLIRRSSFVQDARENQKQWEERFERAVSDTESEETERVGFESDRQ